MKYSVDFIRQFCDCKWRLMQIIILIIIVVNSTVPYLTNNREHIVLYKINKNVDLFMKPEKWYKCKKHASHSTPTHLWMGTQKKWGGGGCKRKQRRRRKKDENNDCKNAFPPPPPPNRNWRTSYFNQIKLTYMLVSNICLVYISSQLSIQLGIRPSLRRLHILT